MTTNTEKTNMSRGVPFFLRALSLFQTFMGKTGFELGQVDTADRRLLEQVILPAISARADVRRVLFVGCAKYTRNYTRIFSGKEYWTLDVCPERARWGADHHVVGNVAELESHFEASSLDAIIINGVIGWGLNEPEDIRKTLVGCREALRTGGLLVLGWDEAFLTHIDLRSLVSSLGLFDPCIFEPLNTAECRVPGRLKHVYNFLERSADSTQIKSSGNPGIANASKIFVGT